MRFLTDFADQAVILPLIAAVAITLGSLGWWRGAATWLVAVGFSFASVLVLKLAFMGCGSAAGVPELRSPSGHAAAAAMIAGGVAVVLGFDRRRVAAAAGLAALAIGATRLGLGFHTIAEVAVGGVLGVLGALGFAHMAGRAPAMRLRWLFAVIVVVAVLLHGQHLNAEVRIRAVAADMPFCACGGTSQSMW